MCWFICESKNWLTKNIVTSVLVLLKVLSLCYRNCCPECSNYYRDILFYCCGGAAILGLLAAISLLPVKIGDRRKGELVIIILYTLSPFHLPIPSYSYTQLFHHVILFIHIISWHSLFYLAKWLWCPFDFISLRRKCCSPAFICPMN